ncbi:MAG: serine/threonine protein kinase [Actinobacteria bacterium]|nr:MAG: serine/threonine protein kinase [Actinomycetota bacterium]
MSRILGEPLELGEVGVGERHAVPGCPRLDRVLAEKLAQLRDVDLHDLVRAGGRRGPKRFGKRVDRDDAARVEEQAGEQRPRLAARERSGLSVDQSLERPEQAVAHVHRREIIQAVSELAAPGQVIGGYRLEELLGEGAAGLVFAARDGEGERVALKLLRPELADDRVMVARFEREARLARDLGTHVVPVLELGRSDGIEYLAMPFYAGGSLALRLRAAGPLGLDDTVELAAQLGRGLDALHGKGILHRDVKPSNVLLDGEGTAALADFGLARSSDSTRLTADGQLLGTPHYLAPELIEGREATRQSDVYALGCVLYECLVGEPPFGGRGAAQIGFAHLTEPPPDPRGPLPELPEGAAHALLAALEKEPEARPTTATALARMLMLGSASPRG